MKLAPFGVPFELERKCDMVNTFGLKMDGLRTAAMSTDDYGWRGLHYNELFYNMRTGKVWTVHQVCVNHIACTEYNNPSIVKIGNLTDRLSEQQMAVKIYRGLLKSGRITRA